MLFQTSCYYSIAKNLTYKTFHVSTGAVVSYKSYESKGKCRWGYTILPSHQQGI